MNTGDALYQRTFSRLESRLLEKMGELTHFLQDAYPTLQFSDPASAGIDQRKVFVDVMYEGQFALGLDLVLVNGGDCMASYLMSALALKSKSIVEGSASQMELEPIGYSIRLDIQGYADEYLGCFSPSYDTSLDTSLFTRDMKALGQRISMFEGEDLLEFLSTRVITRERFQASLVNEPDTHKAAYPA